jgi:predicted porin
MMEMITNATRRNLMQRKTMAAALLTSLALPAICMADDSTVSIYGMLNLDFENVQAEGASGAGVNLASRNRVSSNASNIGFRGIEPLGGGYTAFFQIESGVNVDTGSSSTSTGTFASRNSNLGLAGPFGSIFLGNWDTPFKIASSRLDPFGNTGIGGHSSIIGNSQATGPNAPAGNTFSFQRRQNNSVQYWSPQLAGFSARLAYSANEQKTATLNPSLVSLSTDYENGPLYIGYSYEEHKDYLAPGTKDKGQKLGAGYTFFRTTRLTVAYERLEYEATSSTTLKRNAWFASVNHKMGNHVLRAAYIKADDTSGDATTAVGGAGAPTQGNSGQTGASQWILGYGYSLSKRTELYTLYSRIRNDAAASYDFSTNAIGVSAGADPTGFGAGIKHTF